MFRSDPTRIEQSAERSFDRMEASIEDVLAMARDGGGVEDTEAVALGAVAEAHGWFVEITESAAGGTRIELSGIVPVERAAAV